MKPGRQEGMQFYRPSISYAFVAVAHFALQTCLLNIYLLRNKMQSDRAQAILLYLY